MKLSDIARLNDLKRAYDEISSTLRNTSQIMEIKTFSGNLYPNAARVAINDKTKEILEAKLELIKTQLMMVGVDDFG